MDTTSLSFYVEGRKTLVSMATRRTFGPISSRCLGLVVPRGTGSPFCTEMWPGNTADVTVLLPVIDRLRQRFRHWPRLHRRQFRVTHQRPYYAAAGGAAERDSLQVENLFLRIKAVMRSRPIFHSSDAACDHLFRSFLALALRQCLEVLSRQAGIVPECKTFLQISIACNRCTSAITITIGWSALTSRSRSPICSATPTSRCRHAPSKWRHRNSRRPRIARKLRARPTVLRVANFAKAA